MRHVVRWLTVAAVLCASNGALAQDAARAVSADAELKQKGDDALDKKHYEEALAAYEAAYALRPNPALLYNQGRALQFLARYWWWAPSASRATPPASTAIRPTPARRTRARSTSSCARA